jgi:hypothetical protein
MVNYSETESTISRGHNSAASDDSGQLDSAGQAILKLLHKAAGTVEANSPPRREDTAARAPTDAGRHSPISQGCSN